MQLISLLEEKIEQLLKKQQEIEAENNYLKKRLEEESYKKQIVKKKIEKLLQKIEELNIE